MVRRERITAGTRDSAQRLRLLPSLAQGDEHGRAEADVAAPPPDNEPNKPAPGAGGIDREEQTAAVRMSARRRRLHERRVKALLDMRTRLLAPPGGGRAVGAHRLLPTVCPTSLRRPNRAPRPRLAAKT